MFSGDGGPSCCAPCRGGSTSGKALGRILGDLASRPGCAWPCWVTWSKFLPLSGPVSSSMKRGVSDSPPVSTP